MLFKNWKEKLLNLEMKIWGAPGERESCKKLLMRWFDVRVPGGNQVDGLPPARHTETMAKPGSLGPAQKVQLMDFLSS